MPKTAQAKQLKDYSPYPYRIDSIDLNFSLNENSTRVASELKVQKVIPDAPDDLHLDGVSLTLISIKLDDILLNTNQYTLSTDSLTIHNLPDIFTLCIETEIKPQENTSLEGLYKSNDMYCTQCEAEGFRKITYFPDRPDVLSVYTVTIEAEKSTYPVLLSNGNLIKTGEISASRHYAIWKDPFKKPCYLFALVAGDLAVINDSFTTKSGRKISLQIYTEHHNADKCGHAMASLQKAMAWDEQRFNLEIDLDQYMIVAVDDFNAGAMENKGLNIFNSKYVLANPQTATDADYEGIESVIAHEYFHNWTGNRITCRDWFQLSLKEGLTVFRDQEFTSDTNSRAIKRIGDVTVMRNHQFAEDAGPMAHPIRPESYIEINNFYTLTVYDKGAEVIRMLHTILGEDLFQKGMAIYIQRHDGEAATTEDFINAMEESLKQSSVSDKPADLTLFKKWYSQAGTPSLEVSSEFNETAQTYDLTVKQIPAKVKGQTPDILHIPIEVGLVDDVSSNHNKSSQIFHSTKEAETFQFTGVTKRPVPSLLRNFSAPVKLEYPYSDEELSFLIKNDTDPFCRWDAGQRLYTKHLLSCSNDISEGNDPVFNDILAEVFSSLLEPGCIDDKAFLAQMLSLPTEDYLAEQVSVVNVDAIHNARNFIKSTLAAKLSQLLKATYKANCDDTPYRYTPELAGQRQLKNLCINLLLASPSEEIEKLCLQQFESADNMTDEIASLKSLVHSGRQSAQEALDCFFKKWSDDALVMDKWFAVQATAPLPSTLSHIQNLLEHSHFNIKNPNKVRALIGSFAAGNPVCFHEKSGKGYAFLTDQIIRLDPINSNIASRLMGRLSRWRRYDNKRQTLMKSQIERVIAEPKLSKGVFEIASKSL